MNVKYFIPIVFFLLLLPISSALQAIPSWETTCLNSTHIQKIVNITDRQDSSKILDGVQDVACPYGCDQNRDICWKWPGNALSGEYFVMFEVLALLIFFFVIWRIEATSNEMKVFDVVIPLFGFILFLILALQSVNVIDMSTGEGIPLTMITWLDYGLALLMLIFFFFNLFKWAKAVSEEGGKI